MEIRSFWRLKERECGPSRFSGPELGCLRFVFLVALSASMFLIGCGAPAEPTPPSPPVPVAVSDLAARQAGDGVELVFTLPKKTVTGDRLASAPAVEVVRGTPKADGSPDAKSLRVVSTIPGALIGNYASEGHVRIIDPVAPAETRAHAGGMLLYLVRTRASRKRASADSNAVPVRMFPVAERIAPLQSRVTESAIELSWTAPARTSGGDPLGPIVSYRIYRGELDPASVEAASKDFTQAKWKVPLTFLAPSEEPAYRDTLFDFGKTYAYVVRTVVSVDGNSLESSDSDPAIVTPRDIFPPGAPQNVAAAVLPGATPDSVLVDLSWDINLETDLAGYRVYRSEQEGTKGALVTSDLLLAPAYRDTSVEPGHRYWYTVTAVDRAGNESEPSTAVLVDVAKPSS
jgi:predicted RecA/RadA family phage recombinase